MADLSDRFLCVLESLPFARDTLSHFHLDWQAKQAICPQGKVSQFWWKEESGVKIICAKADCASCPVRAQCTKSVSTGRMGKRLSQEAHQALQARRQEQTTPSFRETYAKRAGIEKEPSRKRCAARAYVGRAMMGWPKCGSNISMLLSARHVSPTLLAWCIVFLPKPKRPLDHDLQTIGRAILSNFRQVRKGATPMCQLNGQAAQCQQVERLDQGEGIDVQQSTSTLGLRLDMSMGV